MLSVEDSAYKHRTKIQKGIWSLPNYAVFALDEGVVSKFYFQPHTLHCFSWWLLLPEQLGTPNTGSLTLACAWTTDLLSDTLTLRIQFLRRWSLGEMLKSRHKSSRMQGEQTLGDLQSWNKIVFFFPAVSNSHLCSMPSCLLTHKIPFFLFLTAKVV